MPENLLLLLCLVVALNKAVFAIDCFSCESVFDEDCGENNFDMEVHFKLDCDDLTPPRYLENEIENLNATACMKKVFIEDGERKVVRSCFFGTTNSTLNSCTRDPTSDPVEEVLCHVCDNESFCNAAGRQLNWALAVQLKITAALILFPFFVYLK